MAVQSQIMPARNLASSSESRNIVIGRRAVTEHRQNCDLLIFRFLIGNRKEFISRASDQTNKLTDRST